MSLSPFVSFQSRFVTYLLTYPRTLVLSFSLLFLGLQSDLLYSELKGVKYFYVSY